MRVEYLRPSTPLGSQKFAPPEWHGMRAVVSIRHWPFAQSPESEMLVRLREGRSQRLVLERNPRSGGIVQHKLPRAHIPQVVGTRMKSEYLPHATFPAAREPRRTRSQ